MFVNDYLAVDVVALSNSIHVMDLGEWCQDAFGELSATLIRPSTQVCSQGINESRLALQMFRAFDLSGRCSVSHYLAVCCTDCLVIRLHDSSKPFAELGLIATPDLNIRRKDYELWKPYGPDRYRG